MRVILRQRPVDDAALRSGHPDDRLGDLLDVRHHEADLARVKALGLPGLTVETPQTNIVFAAVESRRDAKVSGSQDSSFYRSADKGESWTRQTTASAVTTISPCSSV